MQTRKLLSVFAVAALTLAGCATEEIGPEPRDVGAKPLPFDRNVSPTATETEHETSPTPGRQEITEKEGFVEVSDQETDGGSVVIDYAEFRNTDGWVVIHRDQDGQPGEVIGRELMASDLEVKTEQDMVIDLEPALESGEQRLWVMLHIDGGAAGTYEFPGPDVPLVVDGEVVQAPFTVQVN